MSLNDVINWVSDVVRQHEGWAIPIIFFLAFGESLAFLSLLLPATVILLALGALIGESGIAFWPIWAAAASGRFRRLALLLDRLSLSGSRGPYVATVAQSAAAGARPCLL